MVSGPGPPLRNSVEEVRNTDAWVMGQDTSGAGFHETLLKMLQDPSPMVRGNAALSLVRFGDATGRPQIVASAAAGTPYRSGSRSCSGCGPSRDGDSSGRIDCTVADDRLAAVRRNPVADSGANPFSLANGRKCRGRCGDRGSRSFDRTSVGSAAGLVPGGTARRSARRAALRARRARYFR